MNYKKQKSTSILKFKKLMKILIFYFNQFWHGRDERPPILKKPQKLFYIDCEWL